MPSLGVLFLFRYGYVMEHAPESMRSGAQPFSQTHNLIAEILPDIRPCEVVALQHAEERRDIARHVVDDLDLRPRSAAKEDAAHPDEGLGIAIMVDALDHRDQARCKIALATNISRRGCDGSNKMVIRQTGLVCPKRAPP